MVEVKVDKMRKRRRRKRNKKRRVSQSSGGDLLHPPPLGESGTAHRLQDRRDVPVQGRVGSGHRSLEDKIDNR